MNTPAHYSKADAEWLVRALAKLPGLSLPYWCSPGRDALIVSATPYRGLYDAGVRGFAASILLHCYNGNSVKTVPTVLEASEISIMTSEPLHEGSRWLPHAVAEAAYKCITRC